MKSLVISIILIISFWGLSCNLKKSNSKADISDSLKGPRLIDDSTGRTNSPLDSFYVRTLKMVGIESLNPGLKEEEIRIWMSYSFSDSGKIIILRKHQKWVAMIFYLKYNLSKNDNVDSISKQVVESYPVSGWDNILQKIDNLSLYNLKDYKDIPDYDLCYDGDDITIEVTSKGKYRIYSFPCYDVYEKQIPEVKKIIQLLTLIQDEFGFKIFPRPVIPIPPGMK